MRVQVQWFLGLGFKVFWAQGLRYTGLYGIGLFGIISGFIGVMEEKMETIVSWRFKLQRTWTIKWKLVYMGSSAFQGLGIWQGFITFSFFGVGY